MSSNDLSVIKPQVDDSPYQESASTVNTLNQQLKSYDSGKRSNSPRMMNNLVSVKALLPSNPSFSSGESSKKHSKQNLVKMLASIPEDDKISMIKLIGNDEVQEKPNLFVDRSPKVFSPMKGLRM